MTNLPKARGRDPDAMDVDVNLVKTRPLSKEERNKLVKEGCCFHCKKQGHMARQCPDKKKREKGSTKGKRPFKSKAAQVEVVDDCEEEEKEEGKPKDKPEEEPPTYEDVASLVKKIRRLKADHRETLLDTLVEQDFV
jgi:hypothetical protein